MVVDVVVDFPGYRVRGFVETEGFLIAGNGAHQEGTDEGEEVVEPEEESYAECAETEEGEENVAGEAGLAASRLNDN